MFLDSQNQFVGQMDRHLRGEALQLEPGYDRLYAEWEATNKEVLYKLSAEERVQSFCDYVDEYTRKELMRLAGENQALKAEAERGQLILVSRDDGQNFDQILTREEAAKANPIEIRMLTPTLQSTTTDFEEVVEGQELVHTVSKLRDQHFLVNRASVENGVVHVDVTHPRHGQYEVRVDLSQPSTLPLEYEFVNAEGSVAMPETQLPEAYGEAQLDRSLQPVSEEVRLVTEIETRETSPTNEQVLRAAAVGGAGALLMAAELGKKQPTITPEQRAQEAAALTKSSIEQPLLYRKEDLKLPTIMASKAAMQARFARQQKTLETSKQHEADVKAHNEKQQQTLADRKEADRKARKEENKKKRQRRLAAGTGIGAGIATAATGGFFGFLGMLKGIGEIAAHINLFT